MRLNMKELNFKLFVTLEKHPEKGLSFGYTQSKKYILVIDKFY
jgi:hypothetical protein